MWSSAPGGLHLLIGPACSLTQVRYKVSAGLSRCGNASTVALHLCFPTITTWDELLGGLDGVCVVHSVMVLSASPTPPLTYILF